MFRRSILYSLSVNKIGDGCYPLPCSKINWKCSDFPHQSRPPEVAARLSAPTLRSGRSILQLPAAGIIGATIQYNTSIIQYYVKYASASMYEVEPRTYDLVHSMDLYLEARLGLSSFYRDQIPVFKCSRPGLEHLNWTTWTWNVQVGPIHTKSRGQSLRLFVIL